MREHRQPLEPEAIGCPVNESARRERRPRLASEYVTLAMFTLLAGLGLTGCTGPSVSPEQRAALEAPARAEMAQGAWRDAASAWQRAASAAPTVALAIEYRLNAAEALLAAGDGARAEAIAAGLPADLASDFAVRRDLVLADAALLARDAARALSLVAAGLRTDDASLAARYRRIRADALALSGDELGAARERALRDALLASPAEVYDNRRRLWDGLGRVADERLGQVEARPPEVFSGWLELASLARRYDLDAAGFEQALADWNRRYPGHPAGEQIVPELVEQVRADVKPPSRVALLLPQTGPISSAAAAVRDGFMAAWFADAPNPDRPELSFEDTGHGNVALAYADAVARGAQMVIGPLTKEAVAALLAEADLSVTTLTLNYPPVFAAAETGVDAPDLGEPPHAPIEAAPIQPSPIRSATGEQTAAREPDRSRVFFFALAPEDEAARAAEHAFAAGATRAAVLAPEGEWGDRVAGAFEQAWIGLGGRVVDEQRFPDEPTGLSGAVESLLNLDQSERRARRLRQVLARRIEHEPEPRSDIDLIFMAAFPQAARQLRPLLLFHRASKVPVVATSHVYSGRPDAARDQDIEGIEFGDMPWILHPETYGLSGDARSRFAGARDGFARLYAFGADAYALVGALPTLRRDPAARIQGLTGWLSLQPDRRVRRELEWVRVEQGVPIPLASR